MEFSSVFILTVGDHLVLLVGGRCAMSLFPWSIIFPNAPAQTLPKKKAMCGYGLKAKEKDGIAARSRFQEWQKLHTADFSCSWRGPCELSSCFWLTKTQRKTERKASYLITFKSLLVGKELADPYQLFNRISASTAHSSFVYPIMNLGYL